MNIVTLENYELQDRDTGGHLQNFNLSLAPGESCSLLAEDSDTAHLLTSALATLTYPIFGRYLFLGAALDFRKYQHLLGCKKQIGYFGPQAALVSNLTVRQNLLLSRAYFENRLDLDLDDTVKDLCEAFHLTEKLDLRPTALSPLDVRAAIITREITKPLKLFIVDSPEDLIGQPGFDFLVTRIEHAADAGIPLVLLCENDELLGRLCDRTIRIP